MGRLRYGGGGGDVAAPLATAYEAWLTEEVRAQRLGLIVSGVVADFRQAVAADADAVGKEDADSIPVSCLRQVSAVVWYTLALEMGEDATVYRSAWLDSEIYLRRLYQDLADGGGASGATGTPRYAPRSTSGTAALTGNSDTDSYFSAVISYVNGPTIESSVQ